MKTGIAVLVAVIQSLIFSGFASAQPPGTMWTHAYNSFMGEKVHQTSDGGFFVVGTGPWEFNGAMYLMKLDALGNQVWLHNYGDSGGYASFGKNAKQTRDGGYIAVGFSTSGGNGWNVYLVKTDSLGNQLWCRYYDYDNDHGYDVTPTSDGGYIIVGDTGPVEGGVYHALLIKTDSLGHEEWQRRFGGNDENAGYCVRQTEDGGYVIAGAWNYPLGFICRTNSSGALIWTRLLGGGASSVAQTADDALIVVGTLGFGVYSEIFLSKWDVNGNQILYRSTHGTTPQMASSVEQTADYGFVIAGSHNYDNAKLLLAKTDSTGQEVWQCTYGIDSTLDWGRDAHQNRDGGYIFLGWGNTNIGTYLVRTYPEQTEEIILDPATRNYLPHESSLNASPNPFNPSTTLTYELPAASDVKLTVWNTAGRLVATLAQGRQVAGTHTVTFDGSALPSGIYFARLTAGEFTAMQKLVLLQ